MSMGANLDFVEKKFDSMINSFSSKFNEMFNPDNKESHLGKLVCLMEEYFKEGGSLEKLLDPNSDETTIKILKKELVCEFRELRDIMKTEEGKKETIEKTTLKGKEFEDLCEEVLSNFVSNHLGDELERTAEKTGELTDSKKGDFLIRLKEMPSKKIVIETKDWQKISLPNILDIELKEALKNRGADYGIFISKYKEALPLKVGWFNEYRGNMLVCALGSKESEIFFPELINIAYQWAKLRIVKEVSFEQKAIETILDGISQIEGKIKKFSQIRSQCTNIEQSSEKIREYLEEIEKEIKNQLGDITIAIKAVS
jgi:hypothetical protein